MGMGKRFARSDENREECKSRGMVVNPIKLFTMIFTEPPTRESFQPQPYSMFPR